MLVRLCVNGSLFSQALLSIAHRSATSVTLDTNTATPAVAAHRGDGSVVSDAFELCCLLAEGSDVLPASETERSDIQVWVSTVTSNFGAKELTSLNDHLRTRVFLVAHRMTVADLVALPYARASLSEQENASEMYNVLRWAEHMDHLLSLTPPTLASRDPKNPGFRSFNFSPGPGALPDAVMFKAAQEFTNFKGTGMGVIETTNLDALGPTHPGVPQTPLQQMMLDTEHKLRAALSIPPSYRVLFMHGGAVGQFSAVPLNLLGDRKKADIVSVGFWSARATAEAQKYCDVHSPAACDGTVPPPSSWNIRNDAAYVHVCLNETVEGLEFLADPVFEERPGGPFLVADATSTLLSRPIDIARYGCVYASGGKNLPAGVAVVIVRESLLDLPVHPLCPQTMDYRLSGGGLRPASSVFESRPNTPPTFAVYLLGLVLDHMAAQGGLAGMQAIARDRASRVYAAVDGSGGFYSNGVDPTFRSCMNVPFRIAGGDRDLERAFLADAEQAGLHYLFGHPVKGGIRATLYLGLVPAAVDALVAFMERWRVEHS